MALHHEFKRRQEGHQRSDEGQYGQLRSQHGLLLTVETGKAPVAQGGALAKAQP